MTDTKPRLDSLQKAIQRLDEGLERYHRDESDTQIRDGLVQRLEFTYELAHKTLKRYLEYGSATPQQFDSMPFQDLIRSGNEQNLLLSDWPRWRQFREMRSKTSHTYDEDIALEVVSGIPAFLEEAIFLQNRLLENLK